MLVSPLDITPRWVRQRGTPRDLRRPAAQKNAPALTTAAANSDPSSASPTFPALFVLGEDATTFAHSRVELRVAVKDGSSGGGGMVQRILQVDVHASKFSMLAFPSRHVLETFQISHLVEAAYPGELVIRLTFRQSLPGWMKDRLRHTPSASATVAGGDEAVSRSKSREQIWTRTFHTMTTTQRDYLGALLQGVVGISKPVNSSSSNSMLCSPTMLKVGREHLSLWVGTWNMGNKPAPDLVPSKHGLVSPIALWTGAAEKQQYDVYAFGLQEMDPSIFATLEAHFTADKEYVQVCRTNMGVIALAVFCKRRLFGQIRNVQTLVQACGFAGVGTNKGFVCCSLTVMDHPLLFINCHLAARDEAKRLKERIHQYKLAVRKLQLGKLPGTDPLHQHATFFFGDMNFRICTVDKNLWPDSNRTRAEVLDVLYNNRGLDFALQGDQLRLAKARGLVFDQFREAHITFSPTYKYIAFPKSTVWEEVRRNGNKKEMIAGFVCRDQDASEYSKQSAKEDGVDGVGDGYYLSCRTQLGSHRREYTTFKTQVPSWCDRILHRAALPGVRITQDDYYCVDTVASSDHSPVFATFDVELPQPSSTAVPTAAFHVCSIQLLECEVFNFRHPLTPVDEDVVVVAAAEDGLRPSSSAGGMGNSSSGAIRPPGTEDEEERASLLGSSSAGTLTGTTPMPTPRSLRKKSTKLNHHQQQQQHQRQNAEEEEDDDDDEDEDGGDHDDDEESEPEEYTSTRNLGGGGGAQLPVRTALSSQTTTTMMASPASTGKKTPGAAAAPPHLPQLVCAAVFPFMRDTATKSRTTSKPASARTEAHTWKTSSSEPEYVFKARHLAGMVVGPFLCTREFLHSQCFVLHLLPRAGSETRDSAACCVISLEEGADGRTVNFEQPLSHYGQPSGFVRGKYRVWLNNDGWDEEYVASPHLHPLAPKNLAKSSTTSGAVDFAPAVSSSTAAAAAAGITTSTATAPAAATTAPTPATAAARTNKRKPLRSPPPPENRRTPAHPLPMLRWRRAGDEDGSNDVNPNDEMYDFKEDELLLDLVELVPPRPPQVPAASSTALGKPRSETRLLEGETDAAATPASAAVAAWEDEVDDDEEEDDMEQVALDELTRQNTVRNHSARVTAYQTVPEPRVRPVKKHTKPASTKPRVTQPQGKRRHLGGAGASLRRISMMWGVKMD